MLSVDTAGEHGSITGQPIRLPSESPAFVMASIRREIMTTQECDSRDRRIVEKIRTVLQANPTLGQHASLIEVSIEHSAIVVRGNLPTDGMKAELVPAIRRAGVLSQVNNCVLVVT